MADLLITASSGLRAFQQALNVTGHNIANVNTDGYNRQRATIVAATPQLTAGGYMGLGAQTQSVTRVYQDYLTNQINDSFTYQNKYKTADVYSTQLNSTLGDPNVGIFAGVKDLYTSWNTMANDPVTSSSATFLLQSQQQLQQQVQTYRNTRADLHDQVNGQITATVTQINKIVQELVNVNAGLGSANSQAQLPANDLLDSRDRLVKQLNQYLDVKTYQNPDGTLDVYAGDGKIPLITDNRAIPLSADYNPIEKYDATAGAVTKSDKMELWIQMPGTGQKVIVSDFIKGGELGGALAFRKDQLGRAEDELGLSITGMNIAMNAQHRQGFDKVGVRGDNLYSLNGQSAALMPSATSYDSIDNTGSGAISTAGAPASAFAYKIVYNGASYDITDAYTNTAVATGVPNLNGVTLNNVTLKMAGSPEKGDVFMVYSTTDFYSQIEQASYADNRNTGTLNNTDVTVNLDKTGLSNNASGSKFVQNDLSNPADYDQVMKQMALLQPRSYKLVFDGKNYNVTDSRTGEIIPVKQSVDDPVGHPNVSTLRFEGLQVDIDQTTRKIGTGDTFELRFLNDGVLKMDQAITDPNKVAYRGGDLSTTPVAGSRPLSVANNVNAANLASMQDKKILLNRTANIQTTYSNMAGNVGSYHLANKTSQTTTDALYSQLNQVRDSISGVNLDEEAADMMRFQQAYQAAAQIMQASQKMFDTILGAAR